MRPPSSLRARFSDRTLERSYQQWRLEQTRSRTKAALIVGAVIFAMFGIKDIWQFPPGVAHVSVIMQLGCIVPALLVLRYLFDRFDERGAQFALFAGWLVSAVPLIGILVYGEMRNYDIPYEGLILLTFCVCVLTSVNLLTAVSMTFIACAFYIAGMAWAGEDSAELMLEAFYLVTTSVLGCVGVVLLDASSRKEFSSIRKLTKQALIDPLTNLPNRRAAEQSFETIWRLAARNGSSVCVCYIDIDHFKRLNDAVGHVRGDRALQELAGVLSGTAQRPLDFVGRMGGEEFVAFAYGMSPADGLALGEKLRHAVAAAGIRHPDSPVADHLTVSIGVAVTEPTSDDAHPNYKLWEIADQALYAAKRAGRNRTHLAEPGAAALGTANQLARPLRPGQHELPAPPIRLVR